MKRRNLLRSFSLGTASAAVLGCLPADSSKSAGLNTTPADIERHRTKRKTLAFRVRRMIMNNDGHDFNTLAPGEVVTPESMLSKRTFGLTGTHVDSIFYCTGVFNSYTHGSRESDLREDEGKTDAVHFHKLLEQGTDSLKAMASYCRSHGMEVFWSMRMNDKHEATRDYYTSRRWKRDNPDCLLGRKGEDKLLDKTWRFMLDYGQEQAREKVFRILADVARRYDIDGIELDFFRHPVFFMEQATGGRAGDNEREVMTTLMARIRKMADEVGLKRGRPLLLAVRLPDSTSYCRALGLDLERWLAGRLVDLAVFCGYFKLEPWENAAELGRQYGIPVYACLTSRRVMLGGGAEAKIGNEALLRWRGEALAAWRAGINGIYTFNRFDPYDEIFRELGDPNLLGGLERIDNTNYAADRGFGDPGHWLAGGREFIRHPGN